MHNYFAEREKYTTFAIENDIQPITYLKFNY